MQSKLLFFGENYNFFVKIIYTINKITQVCNGSCCLQGFSQCSGRAMFSSVVGY